MSNTQKSVFISYRRDVSQYIARSVFQYLEQNDYDVFMDVEGIDSGRFDNIIMNQIEARPHFVLILTHGTLRENMTEHDFLWREIQQAIITDRNVVPILIEDFQFEAVKPYLSGILTELPRYNALRLMNEYFDEGLARLTDRYLKVTVDATLVTPPTIERKIVAEHIQKVSRGPKSTLMHVTAELYLARGIIWLARKNPEKALEEMNKAIQRNVDYAYAYDKRAQLWFMMERYDRALLDFNQALEIEAESLSASAGKAVTMFALEDNEVEARALWDELVAREPLLKNLAWTQAHFDWNDALMTAVRRMSRKFTVAN